MGLRELILKKKNAICRSWGLRISTFFNCIGINSSNNILIGRVTIKRATLFTLATLFLFRILLDLAMYYVIGPYYSYQRMDVDINIAKLIESYLALFFVFIFMPKTSTKISSQVAQLLILTMYIPLLSYYSISNENREWFLISTIFWILVLNIIRIRAPVYIASTNIGKKLTIFLCVISCLAALIILYHYFGLWLNLSFKKVYEAREIFSNKAIPNIISGYFLTWTGKVFIPFLMLLSIFDEQKKSFALFVISFVCGIYLFGVTGNKVFIFMMASAIALAFLVKKKNFISKLSLFFSFLILLGMLSFWIFKNIWISYLFTRRTFLVPAQISFVYYDFFFDNPVYLSHSILKNIFTYPYDLDPAHLIGKFFFNSPVRSANTGVVADGYMNFGIIGVVLWSLSLGFLLNLADVIGNNKNIKIAGALMMISFYNLANLALLSTILTHGLMFSFLILLCLPQKPKDNIVRL